MADELAGIATALYQLITVNNPSIGLSVGNRAFETLAPQGAIFPYILYGFHTGSDRVAIGQVRIWTNVLYYIKVLSTLDDYGEASNIYSPLDDALQSMQGVTVTVGGVNYWINGVGRESPIQYSEVTPQNQRINHYGGLYRIYGQVLS